MLGNLVLLWQVVWEGVRGSSKNTDDHWLDRGLRRPWLGNLPMAGLSFRGAEYIAVKVGHFKLLFVMVYGTLLDSDYSSDPRAWGMGTVVEADEKETTPDPEAQL